MIKKFIDKYNANKHVLENKYKQERPDSYEDLVKNLIEILSDEDDYSNVPDPERIHTIDDGDYQGTLVFVIGAKGYQPHKYWYVCIFYGSCSGCDALQAINSWSDEISEQEVKDYMSLTLHILQGLKEMDNNSEI